MQFTSTILLTILATLIAAVPTPTIQPRGCTTITPNAMQSLLSTEPTIGYTNEGLNGAGGNGFTIFQDNTQASNRYQMLQFLDFVVPACSYGCELKVTDVGKSVSYSHLRGHEPLSDPGMAHVKVQALIPNAMSIYPSYNDVKNVSPALVSAEKFGSFSIKNGTALTVINGEACPPAMSDGRDGHLQFVFQLEGSDDLSRTRYFNMAQRGVGAVGGLNGFHMTFNC
ncbi:uncharacterized protein RAG0_07321 [Rhynchosporium agropyri]|uniref:Ubiquitin 3 binding protein But2 C-terminal domain-containing protein n=1 Tax=Rhynchosporium agropyri TaxID=914238 RepID=A0A1E1KKY9_9HELO|nr:uncharacterized protein RAG0_07321 [Rhynchosporium agropyri]